MKVLSLFDGMACGMLAMQSAGVQVDRYVAYEIDKYAVQSAAHNFPMIEHRGDVFKADFTEFRGFDAVIGGSPCTFWSIAQKNNRETEASGMGWELFSQFVRAISEVMPRFFIYENNKSMSRAIRSSIDEAFGFEATEINSASVSAQNRQRLYWVGRRNADGTYSKVNVLPPADRGIMLADILETGLPLSQNDKSYALTTRCCGAIPSDTLSRRRHSMVAEPFGDCNGKAFALTASYWKGQPPERVLTKSQRSHVCVPVDRSALEGQTVYEVRAGRISIKGKQYTVKLGDGFYTIRKLTVTECKRLQTVPDWYEFPVSNTQAYKMLGNGWTVEVIKHLILSALADDGDDWML